VTVAAPLKLLPPPATPTDTSGFRKKKTRFDGTHRGPTRSALKPKDLVSRSKDFLFIFRDTLLIRSGLPDFLHKLEQR